MDIYQITSAGLAAMALIVSIISLWKTNKLQRKQEELTEKQLNQYKAEEKMSKKADVRISLEGERFVIRNLGPSYAMNINVKIDPVDGKGSPLAQGDYDKKLPIPKLAPGDDCRLVAVLSFDAGSHFNVFWSWVNEDGSRKEETSRLSRW